MKRVRFPNGLVRLTVVFQAADSDYGDDYRASVTDHASYAEAATHLAVLGGFDLSAVASVTMTFHVLG
jgi:hypothetical protein